MGLMDIRTVLNDLAGGRVSAERIAFLKDQLEALQSEKTELQEELAEAKEELQGLRRQLHSQPITTAKDEFIESSGALFKRKPGGGYHNVVYCPRCRFATKPEPVFDMFHCAPCKWHSPFAPNSLESVMAELPG